MNRAKEKSKWDGDLNAEKGKLNPRRQIKLHEAKTKTGNGIHALASFAYVE
jgi:hypothetical protein